MSDEMYNNQDYQDPPPTPPSGGDSTDKLLQALSYPIPIVGVVLLLTRKEDSDCKYHALNSIFLGIAFFIVSIALAIVSMVLSGVPGVGCIIGIVSMVLPLGFLIYTIMLALQVYNKGEKPVIPVITEFAMKSMK